MKEKLFVFFGFAAALFLIYRNCFGIDIPTDSYTLMLTFEKYGAAGALNNFYDVGMAPVADSVMFVLYKLIGTYSPAWVFCSLLLHSINAFLLYNTGKYFFQVFGIKRSALLALLASALFLLSPYQTEVLLWAPRMFNYHIATGFFIAAFYFLTRYIATPDRKTFYFLHASFLLAIFSFESPLIFPLVSIGFFVIMHIAGLPGLDVKRFFTRVFLPQWGGIAFYLLLCRFWLGSWILHYGASTHMNISVSLIATNYVKYFAKFLLFYRYLPASRSDLLHSILNIRIQDAPTAFLLLGLIAGAAGFFVWRFMKKDRKASAGLTVLFGTFLVSLLPVINLDTSFIGVVISDRYGYLPSVSLYLFLALFFYLLSTRFFPVLNGIVLLIALLCLQKTLPLWHTADEYTKRILKNFEAVSGKGDKLYVLNLPDNYNWILSFRNAFAEHAYLKQGRDVFKEVEVVEGFYASHAADSVRVSQISQTEFRVEALNDSTPKFLSHGLWGQTYSTREYSVEMNPSCTSYLLTFDPGVKDPALVYIAGDQWRRVLLNDTLYAK